MQAISKLASEQPTIDWQHHVDAFHQSGLSKAQYCRDHDLTYHLFIYWSAKLNDVVPDTAAASKAPTGKLVPATITTNNAQTLFQHGLQIHLPNGVHISGIDSSSVRWVGQLIEQL